MGQWLNPFDGGWNLNHLDADLSNVFNPLANNAGNGAFNTLTDAGSGAAAGAAIGSVVPVVGTAVGGIVGAGLGAAKGLYDWWSGGQQPSQDATPATPPAPAQSQAQANTAATNLQNVAKTDTDTANAYSGDGWKNILNAIQQQNTQLQNLGNLGQTQQAAWQQQLNQLNAQQNPYSASNPGFQGYLSQQIQGVNQNYAGASQQLAGSLAARGLMGSGQETAAMNGLAAQQAGAYTQAQNGAYTNLYNNQAQWQQQHNAQVANLLNSNNGAGIYGNAAQGYGGQYNSLGSLSNQAMGLSAQANDMAGNLNLDIGNQVYGQARQNMADAGSALSGGIRTGLDILNNPQAMGLIGKIPGLIGTIGGALTNSSSNSNTDAYANKSRAGYGGN